MNMKKNIVFILIFFLVFFIQFKLANGLTTRCRHYIDGVCQPPGGYLYIEEVSIKEKVPTTTPIKTYPKFPSFIVLIFQLIGIVVLFTLLIIMIQELLKSKGKKSKKGK
ncbi:MAG: hypothetical protein ACTSWZ_02975 [Candidatus Heimdallarchaeaceae archaeon]